MACTLGVQRNLLAQGCVLEDMENSALSIRSTTYVGAYFALWVVVLTLLRTLERFQTGEALAALVILGLIFPALAMLTTRRVSPLPNVVRHPGIETGFLGMYLLMMACLIVSGFSRVARLTTEPLHSVVLLSVKLMAFVAFPASIGLALGHYSMAELMPISLRWRNLRPAVWMSLAA